MFFSEIIRGGLIQKSVGNNLENAGDDVLAVKSRLSALDAFETSNDLEPHGIMTRDLDRSVKRFQREKGLKVDGLSFPNGETESALTQARKEPANRPSVFEKKMEIDNSEKCRALAIRLKNEQLQHEILQSRLAESLQEQNDALTQLKKAKKETLVANGKTAMGVAASTSKGAVGVFGSAVQFAAGELEAQKAKQIEDQARERFKNAKFHVEDVMKSLDETAENIVDIQSELGTIGC